MAANKVNESRAASPDHQKTSSEKIAESFGGKDRPMAKKDRWFPFALIFWSYPLILILILLFAVTAVVWFQK